MDTRARDLLRDGVIVMNENREVINEPVSLGNAAEAVANLAPDDAGVVSALGWAVRVGGLNLCYFGRNRAGA